MITRLDISIGPVQGFVSQSRRTRDLWGSSYLLSFLSAHSMHGAERAGGQIVRPLVANDALYKWVQGSRSGEAPQIGSLPNHFVVEVDGDARSVAVRATEAFATAWRQVYKSVWRKFVKPIESAGLGTRAIWDRQVDGFWEMAWTAGPAGDKAEPRDLLARRKHWRSHEPTEEPGDKCTIMHDLQELSGYVRARDRRSQDQFWCDLGTQLGALDLRNNERLCAVAFVKRMFPKVAEDTLGWDVDRSRWSSTIYVAAVPWIDRVATAALEKAKCYAKIVDKHARKDVFAEQPLIRKEIGSFARLDANWFHAESVKDEDRCPLPDGGTGVGEVREEFARMLKTIAKTKDESGRQTGVPSLYYALLLADGDRLGHLVSKRGSESVGRALADFTGAVEKIVGDHYGVTIYAGGDDVMAMLPLPNALQCAHQLARRYRNAFLDDQKTEMEATLSAGVVLAHIRYPLSGVIREAHRLLDDVAKDGNGRDSMAVGVLKRGGLHCQWTTTWKRRGEVERVPAQALLDDLVGNLKAAALDPGVSSGLIYRVRETLTMLCGWDRWEPGKWGVPDDLDVRAFLQAEIARSFADRHVGSQGGVPKMVDRARQASNLVYDLLKRSRAPSPDGQETETVEVGVDALLLARFLADNVDEEAIR